MHAHTRSHRQSELFTLYVNLADVLLVYFILFCSILSFYSILFHSIPFPIFSFSSCSILSCFLIWFDLLKCFCSKTYGLQNRIWKHLLLPVLKETGALDHMLRNRKDFIEEVTFELCLEWWVGYKKLLQYKFHPFRQ